MRELFGLSLLFWGLFILLTLITYSQQDPGINHVVSSVVPIKNSGGMFGAHVSGLLVDLFGFGAFVWPLVFLAWGAGCVSTWFTMPWWRWFGFFVLGACFISLGSAMSFGVGDVRGGGMMGKSLLEWGNLHFSPAGSWLLWLFMLFISLELAFGISWMSLLHSGWGFAKEKAEANDITLSRIVNTVKQRCNALRKPDEPTFQLLDINTDDNAVQPPPLSYADISGAALAAQEAARAAEEARLLAERLEAQRLEAERLLQAQLEAEQQKTRQLQAEQLQAEQLQAQQYQAEQRAHTQATSAMPAPDRDTGFEGARPVNLTAPAPKPAAAKPQAIPDGFLGQARPVDLRMPAPKEKTAVPGLVGGMIGSLRNLLGKKDVPAMPAPAMPAPAVSPRSVVPTDPEPVSATQQWQPTPAAPAAPVVPAVVPAPVVPPVVPEPTFAQEPPAVRTLPRPVPVDTPNGLRFMPGTDPMPPQPLKAVRPDPVQPVTTLAPTPVPARANEAVGEAQPVHIPPPWAMADKLALPSLSLLQTPCDSDRLPDPQLMSGKGEQLLACLGNFGIRAELVRVTPGPVVTMFEIRPAPGTKVSRIINLNQDLALALKAIAVRIHPIPGQDTLGIEIPNPQRATVNFRSILQGPAFQNADSLLTLALGADIGGTPVTADLARMPHLLVGGATGSGKSVCINTLLLSLLYKATPDELKLLMVDPKVVELAMYADLPHLIHPVVTETSMAKNALDWAVHEMEQRYNKLARAGVRNIAGYNQKIAAGNLPPELADLEPMPYLVIVVDELSDLMLSAGKDVETAIVRLAQLARAGGIHLIIATQRPSVDVVTGLIKANFPSRIAFQVTSAHDSRTILDSTGAELLLGKGDMLFKPSGSKPRRLHGPFVADEDVQAVVDYWKSQRAPDYDLDFSEWGAPTGGGNGLRAEGKGDASGLSEEEALYGEIVQFALEEGKKLSISKLQRRFRIGFNKAARFMERMQEDGIIQPAGHANRSRDVVMGD